ncbi:MAG: hypothetical protein KY455_13880 [Euryarchaeota archaeon]|nr:hypothetical protein [Euryarchaeota archaeon]
MRSGAAHRMLLMAVTLLMFTGLAPLTDAEEVVTAAYDVPNGLQPYTCGRPFCSATISLCGPDWDDWQEGLLNGPEDNALGGPLTTGFTAACGVARDVRDREGRAAVQVGVEKIASECGDCYLDFVVTIDDHQDVDTYFSFCIITPHSETWPDTYCGHRTTDIEPVPDAHVEGCGTGSVSSAVPAGGDETHTIDAMVFATYVDESTSQVCLGTTGDFIVAMS